MADNEQVDPEVQADLELRESTRRERPHRDFGRLLAAAAPSESVTHWPCRNRCGRMVGVTAEGVHAREVHDRKLLQMREAPIDVTRTVFCDVCRTEGAKLAADRNRKAVDVMAEAIRELRGGTTHPAPPGPPPSPERERELMRKITAMHHPDPEGLFRTLREARDGKGAKSSRRSAV